MPGSDRLQWISPNSAANWNMLQCSRKTANHDPTVPCHTSHQTGTTEQTEAMLPNPIPPSNNRGCDHKGVLWDLRGPVTKNLEFQTKMMYNLYIYIHSLSSLEMPVNKVVAVEQLCRLNNSRSVCKADFLKSARHLQRRSTNGQRAKAPTWRKIQWQIKEV